MTTADPGSTQNVVLARLLACERGLLDAYTRGKFSSAPHDLVTLGRELHAKHLGSLVALVVERGFCVPQELDDGWIRGRTLAQAEQLSHETWHDALLDLEPTVARCVRDNLLPDHLQLLRRWQAATEQPLEPDIEGRGPF